MSSTRPRADSPSAASAVSSEALTERVLEVLKDVVQRRTSARSLSERLGHSHNYVRRIVSGEITLQLETLLDMLEELEMPPRLFFDQVFDHHLPDADPVAVLRFYREGDGLPPDPFLEEIEPRVHAAAARPTVEADVESRRERLERLEEERFEDRDGAKEKLERLAREILDDIEACEGPVPLRHLGDLAVTLATWSTICRQAGRRDDAVAGLVNSFSVRPERSARAICLQRAANLLLDLDGPQAGLSLLERAGEIFLLEGDLGSLAKTLVDRGVLLVHLSALDQALAVYSSALKLLPASEWRNRVASHQGCAYCLEESGDLSGSLEHLQEAIGLYGERRDIVLGHLCWTGANLCNRLELSDRSQKLFLDAMGAFEEYGQPIDVALVALDYSRVLLEDGHVGAVSELADRMFECLRGLQHNRIADAALMEFIRTAKWGELSKALIERTKGQLIEASKARTPG